MFRKLSPSFTPSFTLSLALLTLARGGSLVSAQVLAPDFVDADAWSVVRQIDAELGVDYLEGLQ